jgi:hypothetical protein
MRLGLGNRLACDLDTHWLSRADLLEVSHSKGNVGQLVSLGKVLHVKPMLWFVPAIPKTH